MRALRRPALGILIALGLQAVSTSAVMPQPALPSLGTVHIGALPNDDVTPVFYAMQTGMFQRAGLTVILDPGVTSGSAVAAAVAGGSYEIGKSSTTPLFDAHEHGIPFTMIAPAGIYESKHPFAGFIVAKDSPIHSAVDFAPDDLISVSFLHGLTQLALYKARDEAGLDYKGLRFTEVPMAAAMGVIDTKRAVAAEVSQPTMQMALDTGRYRLVPVDNAFGDTWILSVWFTRADYARAHPEVIRAFARIVAEAATYTNAHQSETVALLAEHSHVSAADVLRQPRVTAGTTLWAAGIQPLIDAEYKFGWLAHTFKAEEIIDPAVLPKRR